MLAGAAAAAAKNKIHFKRKQIPAERNAIELFYLRVFLFFVVFVLFAIQDALENVVEPVLVSVSCSGVVQIVTFPLRMQKVVGWLLLDTYACNCGS